MKALLLVLGSVLLASCGAGTRRFSATGPLPATVAQPAAIEADEDRDKEEETSPAEWVDFYLLRRTGGVPLPVEKLLDAKRRKEQMTVHAVGTPVRSWRAARTGASARDASLGNWQALGPGNIGGRTRAFVVRPDDPNTMYAGSEGGGIWMTSDGGNSWNPLTDPLPSLAVATLAMDPNDPNTLYAGTGEWFTGSTRGDSIRGAGIFKTSDGGATWTQLPATATSSFYYVNKIVLSPNNSQHIYAATYGGIWYSPDGGSTWRSVLSRTGTQYGCQDLAIRTDQPGDYLFAACAANGGGNPAIYRNSDAAGAGKWEIVFTTANMARTSIAVAPSNQSVVYAAVSSGQTGDCPTDNSTPSPCYQDGLLGVWRSTSNGDSGSWTQQVSNQDSNFVNTLLFTNPRGAFADICSGGGSKKSWSNQGDYDNVIAVDPTNSDVVWVGGIDLFRSDDGGKNWGIASFWERYGNPEWVHADNHAILFHPGYNGADNQTLFVTNDGGLFRTDNALAPTATGSRAACSPYNSGVIWQTLNNGYAVTQFYHGSVYPGGGAYLGGSQDNNMERGSDANGPNAWTIPNYVGDGGFSAIDPTDPNIWFILGTHLSMEKTTNGGAGFSSAAKGITEASNNFLFIAPLAMDPSNPKRLYTGGKTLWRTTDQAANWSAAASAIRSNAGSISSIAVSPSDPNHVAFGTSAGFVYTSTAALSTDNSASWNSTQPRTGFVSNVAFDPNNASTIYVAYSQYKQNASQSHVYQSTDGGSTWTGIDGSGATGLPDIPVFSIVIDPQNSSNLYIGSDIGVFVSTDGGATWSRDASPFADAVTETLVLDRSAGTNTLFAFTHGRGVWKTVLPGSGAPCQYSLSSNTLEVPAYGASTTFQVTTGDNCAWSAVPANSNFLVSSPAGGQGNGTFSVSSRSLNNTAQTRAGQVTVQDQSLSLVQDAALSGSGNDESGSSFSFGSLPSVVIQNTSGATENANDPMHSCTKSADSKTLWFSVTAQAAGTLTLTYFVNRADNGADAGSVMTVYRNLNGTPGPELTCLVLPQTNAPGLYHYYNSTRTVQPGDSFFVEISATMSGAPADGKLMGGNLTLEASVK